MKKFLVTYAHETKRDAEEVEADVFTDNGTWIDFLHETVRNEIDVSTDPADPNHVVDYDYDTMGRQRFRYDRWGTSPNLTTRPVERTTETVYDNDGRVVANDATYPAGTNGEHKSTFCWNTEGTLRLAKTYQNGTGAGVDPCDLPHGGEFSRFAGTYTSAGELESWTETLTNTFGTTVAKTGAYTYAQDGLVSSRTMDGQTVTYASDRRGMPTRATPWGSGPSYTWNWAPSGALTLAGLPTGAGVGYTYDAAERPSSQSFVVGGGQVVAKWENIAYDQDDNRIAEQVTQLQTDGSTQSGNASYNYDKLGRLQTFKHPFDAEIVPYVLDDAGNVLGDSSSVRTYNANRLVSTQSLRPTLDPGPPPTVSLPGTTTYTYDTVGNRTQDVTATNIVGYTYDAAGHTTGQGGANTTAYRYDHADRLVYQGTNTETRLFFHDGLTGQIALETDDLGVAKTRYVLGPDGAPLANEDASKPGTTGRGHYLSDPRGNVAAVVDDANNVRVTFAYDAFGKGKPTGTSFATGWDSRMRFQTAPRNPTSGSYTIGPRIYDPASYRFVGADSMLWSGQDQALQSDALTGNRYLYAGANPIGLIDDGHSPRWPWSRQKDARPLQCKVDTKARAVAAYMQRSGSYSGSHEAACFLTKNKNKILVGTVVVAGVTLVIGAGAAACTAATAGVCAGVGAGGVAGGEGAYLGTAESASSIGASRVAAVMSELGGNVAQTSRWITTPYGSTDIDIVTRTNQFIEVGGPAKAENLAKFGQQLQRVAWYAQDQGGTAIFRYAPGTPQAAIDLAEKWFGAGNARRIG